MGNRFISSTSQALAILSDPFHPSSSLLSRWSQAPYQSGTKRVAIESAHCIVSLTTKDISYVIESSLGFTGLLCLLFLVLRIENKDTMATTIINWFHLKKVLDGSEEKRKIKEKENKIHN